MAERKQKSLPNGSQDWNDSTWTYTRKRPRGRWPDQMRFILIYFGLSRSITIAYTYPTFFRFLLNLKRCNAKVQKNTRMYNGALVGRIRLERLKMSSSEKNINKWSPRCDSLETIQEDTTKSSWRTWRGQEWLRCPPFAQRQAHAKEPIF